MLGTFSKFNTGLPNQELAGLDSGEGCSVQVSMVRKEETRQSKPNSLPHPAFVLLLLLKMFPRGREALV